MATIAESSQEKTELERSTAVSATVNHSLPSPGSTSLSANYGCPA